MCPDRLILVSKEGVGVELVRVHRSSVIIFHSLSRHRVVAADGDLRENVVLLYGDEDVVGWYVGISARSVRVAEGGEDVLFAMIQPCFQAVRFWPVR